MMKPGPLNLITDVPGIKVGNSHDEHLLTGVTVILPETPVIAAVAIHGGAPGTRETDLLDPSCAVDHIDGICFSGGSVFGLRAADATVNWLTSHGKGYPAASWRIPIVPGAIIFDLAIGEFDPINGENPYADLARRACDSAEKAFKLGNIGAGIGATAGAIKGGLGSSSITTDDGLIVGALAVTNPLGSVTMPGTNTFWAWALAQNDELGQQIPPSNPIQDDLDLPNNADFFKNTTLAVIATNVSLNAAEAKRVAIMAHDGLARAMRPAHTPLDGDTLFVMAGGDKPLQEKTAATMIARIGTLSADCIARAISRAVYEAGTLGGVPSYKSTIGL